MSSVAATTRSAAMPASGAEAAPPSTSGAPPRGAVPKAVRASGFPKLSFSSSAETYLALGVITVIALLIIPLPSVALDLFLALSFALSIVTLLVVLSARDPIEFNIFPSLLLLITLFRLGLNVSSTRLILSSGQAGQVISAFGNFVIGGNIVVGLVIFLILVVINFVVITKGAGRVAEVAARFTLDAMPGRQMSIDADLGAGLIDENEARRRREEINRYADFYGSMDGAAKFVRGDAIAGIIITAINLVGGFVIGVTQRGMSGGDAITTFGSLTVGDGLVTQIPALVVSTAAGILVTYGSTGGGMAPSLGSQLTRNPRAIWTASAMLVAFAIIPGLPPFPFLFLATVTGALAFVLSRRAGAARVADEEDEASAGASPTEMPAIRELLSVEDLELEIGYGLVPLVDESQNGDLLPRIGIVRKQLAMELGILVPPVRVRDNIQLSANEYSMKIRGVRIAGGELALQSLLALDTTGSGASLPGTATTDPSFGIPAVWIAPEARLEAEAAGYTVVDPTTVLTTHIMETIREHAADLLSRQRTQEMVDGLKESNASLVEDLIPGRVTLGTLHRVLQRLVREGIPVRDLVTILEALSDAADQTKDPEVLTEHVRRSLAMVISQLLAGDDGVVRGIAVGPRLELALMQTLSPSKPDGARHGMDPSELTAALETLNGILADARRGGSLPPLITPPALRVGIRRLIESSFPRLAVVSLAELPPQTPIQTLSMWELSNES